MNEKSKGTCNNKLTGLSQYCAVMGPFIPICFPTMNIYNQYNL